MRNTISPMELLKIKIDGDELTNVPFTSNQADDVEKVACWQHRRIEIRASLFNETLSLQIHHENETVLIFAGKITAPATFECKLADGKKLTLNLT